MYKNRVQGFLRLTRNKNRTRMTTTSGQVITAGDRQVLINYRINCELGAERPVPLTAFAKSDYPCNVSVIERAAT